MKKNFKKLCSLSLIGLLTLSSIDVTTFAQTLDTEVTESIIETENESENEVIENTSEEISTEVTESSIEEILDVSDTTKDEEVENVISDSTNTETEITNNETSNNIKTEINETTENIIEVNTLNEFSDEISNLCTDDELGNTNTYATKRLLVTSETSEFDTCGATSIINYGNLYVLSFDDEATTESTYNILQKDSNILSVEIDSIMKTEESSDDSYQSTTVTKEESSLKQFLNTLSSTKNISVAVLDTGITYSEFNSTQIIDLKTNLSSSGNVDSIEDDNGHGTEMAHLILNNSNEHVRLMPIKIANSDGKATLLSTYLGIQKAIECEADIINISMNSASCATSQILEDIINTATSNGILVIVSAGNDSTNVKNISPANVKSAIVISSINDDNTFADYSNFGDTIDYCSYGSYNGKSGTSYSTATVTGIIADVLSKKESVSLLDQYAIDLGTEDFDEYYGNGLISLTETKSSLVVSDERKNIYSYENWKDLSYSEIIQAIDNTNQLLLGKFLSELSEDDLNLILSIYTDLSCEYTTYDFVESTTDENRLDAINETNQGIYYKYLINLYQDSIKDETFEISNFKSTSGYFYVWIYGNGNTTKMRIDCSVSSTSTDNNNQKVTATGVLCTSNYHSLSLTGKSKTYKVGGSSGEHASGVNSYNADFYFSWSQPSGYSRSYEYSDKISGNQFSIQDCTTTSFTVGVNLAFNAGFGYDGNSSNHAIAKIALSLNSYSQVVYARYQNADGTWGNYSAVINKNYNYGSTVSWSRAADATYAYAGISYTVTGANTKYVDVPRNASNQTINYYKYNVSTGAWDFMTQATYSALYGSTFTLGADLRVPPSYFYVYAINIHTGANAPYTDYPLWNGSSCNSYVVAGANTIHVHYYPNSYTVTVNKGTGIASVSGGGSYLYGKSATINATLSTGYHWSNWTGSTTYTNMSNTFTVDGAKSFTANAAINTSTLKVNPNGGTWNSSTATQFFTQNYNTTKSIPIPTRTGYKFTGWTRTNTYGSITSTTSAATYTYGATNGVTDTLTANWSINSYNVTYIDKVDSTSGTTLGSTTKSIAYGTAVSGSDIGSSTTDNAYYNGYYYDSCTSATVGTSGATVYRIFKLRTKTISGSIIWEDWNNKNLSRPDNVTLHLTDANNKVYDFTITGNNTQNTSINTWAYNVSVPKYDSNGNEISYTASQDKAISKESGLAYETPVVNGFDITNKINSTSPTLPKISIVTYVIWNDNNNKYNFRPNEVTISLLQNGTMLETITTSDVSYKFENLYKYDENGNEYTYTITSNDVDRYSKSIDNDYYEITYTFSAPTYSVVIPKTVIIDGQTGIGEYSVSVKGNIDDRDSVNVTPSSSFEMSNKYLSNITATVNQTLTKFTNKNNIQTGATTKGTISAKSLAGEWYGSFNFNIAFEFGK